MKISRFSFKNKDYVFEENFDFSNEKFNPNHIRSIGKTHVKITGNDYDDFLVLDFNIVSEVVGVCSYSLEDVPLTVKVKTSLSFTFEEEDEDVLTLTVKGTSSKEYEHTPTTSETILKSRTRKSS